MGILHWFKKHGRTSYAQSGEDLIADYILNIVLRVPAITYLDIGTNDPVHLNNTYYFYAKGCRGVCVEPNPQLCKKIRRKRRGDAVLNVGIGNSLQANATFYLMDPDTLSTFSRDSAEEALRVPSYKLVSKITVPQVAAADLIEKHFEQHPNLVSIDVEGGEIEILTAFDFVRHRPEVFCIETVTHTDEIKRSDIIQYMLSQDYVVYADTFINTLFIEGAAWRQRQIGS